MQRSEQPSRESSLESVSYSPFPSWQSRQRLAGSSFFLDRRWVVTKVGRTGPLDFLAYWELGSRICGPGTLIEAIPSGQPTIFNLPTGTIYEFPTISRDEYTSRNLDPDHNHTDPHCCDVLQKDMVMAPRTHLFIGAYRCQEKRSELFWRSKRNSVLPRLGLPGRSSRPCTGFEGNVRLCLRLRRGRLLSRPMVENEAWWVARGSNSPTAAIVVQGSSEGGAHEPLADGGETPRPRGASNPDHRIKSPTHGLSATTTAKREQQNPTGNTLSFNTLIDSCFAEDSWLELRLVVSECPTSVPRANRRRTPRAAPGSAGGLGGGPDECPAVSRPD